MFKVSNLTVYFKHNNEKHYLLKDICFNLNKGDCLGVIGKTGEGKSTLAKSLIKIYDNNVFEETNNIYLNNIPFDKSWRGKKISILFQNPNTYLNPLMKIGKQISEMLTIHYKFKKKQAKLETINYMKKVGLENCEKLYNCYPYEISGGMQQKICLCIALICNPDVLILDEFASYLDSKSKAEILSLIKNIQIEQNLVIIMISHNLNEIYSICNKIAVMKNGAMVEFATTNEIIFNPIHPYTVELLNDYLRFYENVQLYSAPTNDENSEIPPITMISDTHYIRSSSIQIKKFHECMPINIKDIKEKVYEHLNNK